MLDKKHIIYTPFKTRRLVLKYVGLNKQLLGDKRKLVRHNHDLWSFDFCVSGTSKIQLEQHYFNFKRGDIMLIAPGDEHRFIYNKDAFCCYSFKAEIPDSENLPKNSLYIGDLEGLKSRLSILEALTHLVTGFCPEELLNSNMPFPINSSFVDIHILEEFLYGIVCHYIFGDNNHVSDKEEDSLIKQISEFIYLHNGKPVSVEDLASHFGYSAGHLRTIVFKHLKMSTKTFIDLERIKIIKNLLMYSDIRIGELSSLMEFKDTKYFTRFFRKYTGKSPREWAKEHSN